jgi:hypothetical protein
MSTAIDGTAIDRILQEAVDSGGVPHVAALQQMEQGNLDLDAPVADYCPEFADVQVMNQEPDWWAGGHGLYGPPSDYIKFEQALLRGGQDVQRLRKDRVRVAVIRAGQALSWR